MHCRLENISADGHWLADECFSHAGKDTVRKAGEPVPGSIMPEWRKLRQQDPKLFASFRIWQQPAAVVDSIIWRWQCELEASEYRQALRVTDCLPAAWAAQSKEASFLLQQIGCPVAASCTPLQQPTDTHLAKPAKDAGRREKERLRELMRLAAIRLNEPVQYESTKREIVQVAVAMHTGMVELNSKSDTVLQACRAGGWFAYRPNSAGKLLPADREVWAQAHVQAAGRVAAHQLAERFDWLDAAGKPQLFGVHWQAECASVASPADVQREPEPDCLDLGMELGHLDSEADYQSALQALLPPSARQDADLLAQIEGLGLYKKARSKQDLGSQRKQPGGRVRQLRGELAAKFREALSAAGGVSNRLAQLQPKTGPKGKSARGSKPASGSGAKQDNQHTPVIRKFGKRLEWRARKN